MRTSATSTLSAYYPWQEGGVFPAEFSVKADQSGDQLHGFGPDRGREGGRQADAVVHADDFQAQDVAHRYRRDERSGFDITNIVIKGAVGTGVLDPATGNFTAKADAEASDLIANTATANKVYYALLVPQNGVKLMGYRHHGRRQETHADARYGPTSSRVRTAAWSATCSRPTSR